MRAHDLTGQRFGKLTAVRRIHLQSGGTYRGAHWLCRCDCGEEKIVAAYLLKSKRTKSCGCLHKGPRINDLTDQRFGRLVVVKRVQEQAKGTHWLCKCDCGGEKVVSTDALKAGRTKSCGCLQVEWSRELYKLRADTNKHHLQGRRFKRLTVLHRTGKGGLWACQCDCGQQTQATSTELLTGQRKSCGCLRSKGKKTGTEQ